MTEVWLTETYYEWLRNEAFASKEMQEKFNGALLELHDIPFYWSIWADENRVGDALAFRQHEFLGFIEGIDEMDSISLGQWATAAPSTLEVLLGIARRWSFYFGDDVTIYFHHLFTNLEMTKYPGKHLVPTSALSLRRRVDIWLSRQFNENGEGSPFPIRQALPVVDMRKVDIWTQMNAYSAEHFQ